MRKILSIIGGVFLTLIAVIGGFIGYAAYQGRGLDASSKAYVEENVPKILSSWSKEELLKRSSPQLLKAVEDKPDQSDGYPGVPIFGRERSVIWEESALGSHLTIAGRNVGGPCFVVLNGTFGGTNQSTRGHFSVGRVAQMVVRKQPFRASGMLMPSQMSWDRDTRSAPCG